MTKKQRELLLKVKAKIMEEPAQFVMGHWFMRDTSYCGLGTEDIGRKEIPNCGTAACIAGWVVTIAHKKTPAIASYKFDYPDLEAARLLGLEYGAATLFVASYWPDKFSERWFKARTLRGRARVAADRIDHFIATDGRE